MKDKSQYKMATLTVLGCVIKHGGIFSSNTYEITAITFDGKLIVFSGSIYANPGQVIEYAICKL